MAEGHARTTPARLGTDKRLTMDLVQPVFAPLYTDAPGNRNMGALVFTVDVTDKIREISALEGQDGTAAACRILQRNGSVIQEIPADGTPPRDLPGWLPDAHGNLPIAKRIFPGQNDQPDQAVFSLGMPVPDMLWLVSMDIPEREATAGYETFRRSVILSAALLSVLTALVLFMLWWWLLGRGERAMAREMHNLYETVNRQKQILDGVNTTLADGIILNDLQGYIPYANQAFTLLASETPQSIISKTCRTLTSVEMGRNIVAHTEAVVRANAPLTFTDILHLRGQDRTFQVASTPFRNEQGGITGVVSVYRDISELVNAQARAQYMVNQTVTVFVRAIEAVDPYLHGHSSFTGILAASLASRMDLASHEATLRTAANLSQIGMIQLPRDLLAKTEKLTREERARLETHVEYAQAALEGIDFGLPVLDAIVQMHERLDGSGYPRHLQGDAIGMDARILAVANTFCAVLRPRSYRQAHGLDKALDILSETPIKYDPFVVKALDDYLATPAGQEFLQELSS